jgi:hypothetical protein
MNKLTQLLTGKDGVTHDIARWSWIFSLLGVFSATICNSLQGHEVDLTSLGTAIAAVVSAHGAAIWAKKDTEPGANS